MTKPTTKLNRLCLHFINIMRKEFSFIKNNNNIRKISSFFHFAIFTFYFTFIEIIIIKKITNISNICNVKRDSNNLV